MSTTIRSECPNCQQTLKVSDSLFGRRVKCPSCQHQYVLSSFAPASGSNPSVSIVDASVSDDETTTGRGRYRSDSEPSMGHIGRFELKAVLGHGGFGRVFRAYDPQLDRQVALKVPKFAPEEKKKIRRFLTEAKAAAGLRHPNIVALFESGRAGNDYFIASEYVAGRTLAESIKDGIPPATQAAEWVRDLATALAYAHAEGIIHRDIKPENVMIGANGRPQVMDFGLAKRMDEDSSMTAEGGVLGTPAYMSPEQARGETNRVGPQSDQYSLGVVLYELLTGRKPFEGPPHTVIAQVASNEPPPVQSLNAAVPRDLAAICAKSMEKEPQKRYENLTALADDLDRWLSGREVTARPIGRGERLKRWVKKNPVLAVLGTALAAALVVGTIVSSYFAVSANQAAIDANNSADLARQQQEEADAARIEAERISIESQIDRAVGLCEQGEIGEGLVRLSHILSDLPESSRDFEYLIRANIVAWWQRHHDLLATFGEADVTGSFRVTFTKDGKRLLTGNSANIGQFWDISTAQPVGPTINNVLYGTFSPDGRRAIFASNGSVVTLWDMTQNKFIKELDIHQGKKSRCVQFSPDGKLAVSAGVDKTARFFNPETGELIGEPMTHNSQIQGAAFNPVDGKTVATAGYDNQVLFWTVPEGKPTGQPLRHARGVMGVAYSPDGKLLLTACDDQSFSVWDVQTYKRRTHRHQLDSQATSVSWAPDGTTIATSTTAGTVQIWDAKTFEPTGVTFRHRGDAMQAAFSPSGKELAVGTWFDYVRLWKVNDNQPAEREFKTREGINCSTFTYDGRRLAVGCTTKLIAVWDLTTGNRVGKDMDNKNEVAPRGLAFSPDGQKLISCGANKKIKNKFARLWNVETGDLIGNPLEHNDNVTEVRFAPDNVTAMSASLDGTIKIWNTTDGTLKATLTHGQPVTSIAIDAAGTLLASGATDGSIRLWDLTTKQLTPNAANLEEPLSVLSLAPNKKSMIGAGENGTMRCWTFPELEPYGEPMRHSGKVYSVDFGPDGGTCVSASDDGTAQLWNLRTTLPIGPPMQSRGQVYSCRYSPDGKTVVTGSQHGEVQLWDATKGKPIGAPRMHRAAVNSLSFSPDGKFLFSGALDSTGKLWPVLPSLDAEPERIRLWIETITRYHINQDRIQYIEPAGWMKGKQELDALGGPPIRSE